MAWLGFNGLIVSHFLKVIFLKRASFNVHIHILYFTDTYHNHENRLLVEKNMPVEYNIISAIVQ